MDNLVLMTSDEADAHDAAVGSGGDDAGGTHGWLGKIRDVEPEIVATVEAKFRRVRRDFGLQGDKLW